MQIFNNNYNNNFFMAWHLRHLPWPGDDNKSLMLIIKFKDNNKI